MNKDQLRFVPINSSGLASIESVFCPCSTFRSRHVPIYLLPLGVRQIKLKGSVYMPRLPPLCFHRSTNRCIADKSYCRWKTFAMQTLMVQVLEL